MIDKSPGRYGYRRSEDVARQGDSKVKCDVAQQKSCNARDWCECPNNESTDFNQWYESSWAINEPTPLEIIETQEDSRVEEHILYRMFDCKYRLLYAGITLNVHGRMKQHGSSKDWWPEVQHIILERFPSRAELAAAERRVIVTEHPKYNKQHNMIGVGR